MPITRIIVVLLILLLGPIWVSCTAFAQVQDNVEVVFKQDVPLRSLAENYLGNPNEWKVILYYNGFQHLADLQPNTKLIIPARLFARTMELLQQAGKTARLANMEGAGVLAQDSIETSARLQTRAMDLKNQGKLEAAEQAAREAIQWVEKALSEAKEKKIQSVSAILAQKEGTVQSRRPEQPVWIDAIIDQDLIEQERVRTLSVSRAGILFIDGSQIQLNENSLAVIGEMKENLIKRTFKAGIVVLQGDVLAHLSSLGGQKDISITSPGIETTIRSKKFRTTRDMQKVTRIANYDGEIDVEASRVKVTIQKDEGTKVEYGKEPETPRKLLPPPVMISPLANQILLSSTVRFEWENLEGARLYNLEISAKRDFSTALQRKQLRTNSYEWQAPHKGLYYYRIYTIDEDNFSGPFSDPVDFYVDIDESPPYLAVFSPAEGEIIVSRDAIVQGTVEKNTRLTINAVPVEYDQNGLFKHLLRLEPGEQLITVTATDPAGNRTSIQRHVICNLEEQLISLDTPNHVTVNMNQVTIKGTIKPLTTIELNGESIDLPQRFSHIATLPEGEHTLTFKATSPQGNIQTLPVIIKVDLTPPEIYPDDIPAYTRKTDLRLSGRISETVTLQINNEAVPVKDGRFDELVTLQEGENIFELEAVDTAGNSIAKTIHILRDTKPPDITNYTFSSHLVKGGDIIACQVRARDSGVGLARTGSFTISVVPKNTVFNGILTLNHEKEMFAGSIFIPPEIQGMVEMRHLQIQDRLGNKAVGP